MSAVREGRRLSADTLRPSMRTPAAPSAPTAHSPCGLCPNLSEGECQQPVCEPEAPAHPLGAASGAAPDRAAPAQAEQQREGDLQIARELAELLRRLGLLHRSSRLIDYGCGLGFLLEGFHEAGYPAEGVEPSAQARGRARAGLRIHASLETVSAPVDLLVARDVFQHLPDEQVRAIVATLRPRALVCRVPCATHADPPHRSGKEKVQWERMLEALGYLVLRLSLHTVYDSSGVACLLGIRRAP